MAEARQHDTFIQEALACGKHSRGERHTLRLLSLIWSDKEALSELLWETENMIALELTLERRKVEHRKGLA